MSAIRGALTALLIVLMTVVLGIAQAVIVRFWPARAAFLPYHYHRAITRLLDIKIDIEGRLADGPLLITSNHVSWLDISVLSAIGRLSFIAKHEVASWPGFGTMARLQRTVFVNRERRTHTAKAKTAIEQRLDAGDRMVLFAEGTSSDGNRVLPFRTALFGVASYRPVNGDSVTVQPLSLTYTRLHGLPIDRHLRPMFAWYGDMSMLPHIWGILRAGPIDVKIVLHDPVTLDELGDRKALAVYCETRVRAGVLSALLGRPVRADQAARLEPAIVEPA